eukprot:831081-Rhodomonas_salina.3
MHKTGGGGYQGRAALVVDLVLAQVEEDETRVLCQCLAQQDSFPISKTAILQAQLLDLEKRRVSTEWRRRKNVNSR